MVASQIRVGIKILELIQFLSLLYLERRLTLDLGHDGLERVDGLLNWAQVLPCLKIPLALKSRIRGYRS